MSLSLNEPVPHTCPLIDEVITSINSALDELRQINKHLQSHPIESSIDNLDGLEQTMEKIRSANTDLRDWGDRLNGSILHLEEEIEKLENEKSE